MRMDYSSGKPTDTQVLAALTSGDISALGVVYQAYADRLFSYAVSITGQRENAADAVSDTFLLAHARIGQLRDQSKLRPWLYAICRNECLRILRAGTRTVTLDHVEEVADMSTDLDAGVGASDARALIESAFEGMNQNDRELIELALRQELSPIQIGEVLGVSSNNAAARLSNAKAQLERAVGALVLLRSRGSACSELRGIVAGQEFTPLLRKRIARHAEGCGTCSAAKTRAVAAVAMTSLPILSAPAWLRQIFGGPSVISGSGGAFPGQASAATAAIQHPASPVSGTDEYVNVAGTPGEAGGFGSGSGGGVSGPPEIADGVGGSALPADVPGDVTQVSAAYSSPIPGSGPGDGVAAGPIPGSGYPLPMMDTAALETLAHELDAVRPPFDRDGWPRPLESSHTFPLVGAAAGAMLIAVAVVGWSTLDRDGYQPTVGVGPLTSSSTAPSSPSSSVKTPSESKSTNVSPTTKPSSSRPPTPTTASPSSPAGSHSPTTIPPTRPTSFPPKSPPVTSSPTITVGIPPGVKSPFPSRYPIFTVYPIPPRTTPPLIR